ncbi:hypothetical protein Q7P37_005499 [Cladosporium fusiforme]
MPSFPLRNALVPPPSGVRCIRLMFIDLLTLWLSSLIIRARAAHRDMTSRPGLYNASVDNGSFGYYPTWSFATEGDISAPQTNWLQWDPRCNDGTYYFLTPRGWGLPQPGPMILDWRGDLVWSKHFANEWGGQAYDFMAQHYQGQDYLTFWTGDDRVRGHGSGSYMMLDSSYELVHTANAANGFNADLHEFLLTQDGTALITVYQKYQHDISDRRMFNLTDDPNDANPNWIWDCLLQEISVDTRTVIFEWRASDHIDVNDTYHGIAHTGNYDDPFDWFHMNSIRKDELGNYLISARYTHSITYIDGKTGQVIWILGGKSNMFMDLSNGSAINFAWQHDAQFVSPMAFPELYEPPRDQPRYTTRLLSLFDNAAEDQNYMYGEDQSRGLLLEITFPTPGYRKSGDTGLTRDISHLRRLAEKSNTRISEEPPRADSNLPYPNYSHNKLRDQEINRLKVSQTNSSNSSHTVRVIQVFSNPLPVRSSSQGSMQILPPTSNNSDARVFIGYGLNAVFTEFDANGTALCDAHYGAVTSWERGDIQSYRACKFPWIGRPKYKPRIALDEARENVYVSWNGATEVVAWLLQASGEVTNDESNTTTAWHGVQRKHKSSFETAFALPWPIVRTERYIRILAIDANHEILDYGVSEIFDRFFEPANNSQGVQDEENALTTQPQPKRLSSPFTILIGGFLAVMAAFTLFEVYRRYLCWKVGRPSIGAVRWRKGSGVDEQAYILEVLDMNGMSEYSELRKLAISYERPGIDIFLACFSIEHPASLQHIKDVWLPEIRQPCPNAQFLLIGLRADSRDDSQAEDQSVTREKAISTAAEWGAIKYLECSSVLNYGVREVFAEALIASIQMRSEGKATQQSAALIPSPRARSLGSSVLGLPKMILKFRGRLQYLRGTGRLAPITETVDSSAQEYYGVDVDEHAKTITAEEGKPETTSEETASRTWIYKDQDRRAVAFIRNERRGASADFEETLSKTWLYKHQNRRAGTTSSAKHLPAAPSIRDSAILTSRAHNTLLTITPSTRSLLSAPIGSILDHRLSCQSWGSAEQNAAASMEVIEQYAATLESLQTEFEESRPPRVAQAWNGITVDGNARVMNGNVYNNVTNHFTIIYNLTIAGETAALPEAPPSSWI